MVNSGLISLPGKLTYLLVHVYSMHLLFERGNNGQNCAYYSQILRFLQVTRIVFMLKFITVTLSQYTRSV